MRLLWNRLSGYHQSIQSIFGIKKVSHRVFKLSSETKVTARDKKKKKQCLETKITAKQCLPWLSHYGVQVPQPSAARCDPTHGGTEHPEPGLCWMWLKETSPCLGMVCTISWAGKDKGEEAVWGHWAPHSLLQSSVDFILMHRWAVGWGRALAWAVVMGRKAHGVSKVPLATAQREWNALVLQGTERKRGGWGRSGISWSGACNDLVWTSIYTSYTQDHQWQLQLTASLPAPTLLTPEQLPGRREVTPSLLMGVRASFLWNRRKWGVSQGWEEPSCLHSHQLMVRNVWL